jgi:hypothetical protein
LAEGGLEEQDAIHMVAPYRHEMKERGGKEMVQLEDPEMDLKKILAVH